MPKLVLPQHVEKARTRTFAPFGLVNSLVRGASEPQREFSLVVTSAILSTHRVREQIISDTCGQPIAIAKQSTAMLPPSWTWVDVDFDCMDGQHLPPGVYISKSYGLTGRYQRMHTCAHQRWFLSLRGKLLTRLHHSASNSPANCAWCVDLEIEREQINAVRTQYPTRTQGLQR